MKIKIILLLLISVGILCPSGFSAVGVESEKNPQTNSLLVKERLMIQKQVEKVDKFQEKLKKRIEKKLDKALSSKKKKDAKELDPILKNALIWLVASIILYIVGAVVFYAAALVLTEAIIYLAFGILGVAMVCFIIFLVQMIRWLARS